MKRELVIIPKVTIHPNKIFLTNEYNFNPPKPKRSKSAADSRFYFDSDYNICEKKDLLNEKFIRSSRSAEGIMKKSAIKKVSRSVNYLVMLTNSKKVTSRTTGRKLMHSISFLTLTLSSKQQHSDNEIKEKLLNQFLIELRRNYKIKNYIWRAEKQKNGNIHFHVLLDRFIPWSVIRFKWNRIQEKLGYITDYSENQKEFFKNGFKIRTELLNKWNEKAQYKAYLSGLANDFRSPNSTDIHNVRKVINVDRYLCKYVTKNVENAQELSESEQQNLLVQGRLWGCNYELSNIKGCQLVIDDRLQEELKKVDSIINPFRFNSDYFQVVYLTIDDYQRTGSYALFKAFAGYLFSTFGYSGQLSLSG